MTNSKEKIYLTPHGLERVKNDYERLLKSREDEDNDSENLVLINQRIEETRSILKTYELIKSPAKNRQHIINLGATVVVEINGQSDEFIIVGTIEANPSLGRISNESPVGRALLGRRIDEEVIVSSAIKAVYKIKEIKYDL